MLMLRSKTKLSNGLVDKSSMGVTGDPRGTEKKEREKTSSRSMNSLFQNSCFPQINFNLPDLRFGQKAIALALMFSTLIARRTLTTTAQVLREFMSGSRSDRHDDDSSCIDAATSTFDFDRGGGKEV